MNPLEELIRWYHSLPPGQRGFMARMYFFLTTDNTSDLALSPDEAERKFVLLVIKNDFQPRTISRLAQIRSILDLILENRSFFLNLENLPFSLDLPRSEKLSFLEPRQWEKVYLSWLDLRAKALSDKILSSLLQNSKW